MSVRSALPGWGRRSAISASSRSSILCGQRAQNHNGSSRAKRRESRTRNCSCAEAVLFRSSAAAQFARPGLVGHAEDRMQAITLEVILRAVFGVTDETRREQLRELLAELAEQHRPPCNCSSASCSRAALPRLDPLSAFCACCRRESITCCWRRSPNGAPTRASAERTDILSLLVSAVRGRQRDERLELRDQLIMLLLAGHETTATAPAWTIDPLPDNPATLERLHGEVRTGPRRHLPEGP